MRTYIDKVRTLPEPEKIICNRCGREYNLQDENIEPWIIDTIIHISYQFGYGSAVDGSSLDFDICEKCLDEITKDFKIPAERSNYYG